MTRQNYSTMAQIGGPSSLKSAYLDDGGTGWSTRTEEHGSIPRTTITFRKARTSATSKHKTQSVHSRGTSATTWAFGFGHHSTAISGAAAVPASMGLRARKRCRQTPALDPRSAPL